MGASEKGRKRPFPLYAGPMRKAGPLSGFQQPRPRDLGGFHVISASMRVGFLKAKSDTVG